MYVYVLDHVLALRSRVDAEPLDEYQEPPSSEAFEQQQENFEEGKYNMNILSLFNTNFILHFKFCMPIRISLPPLSLYIYPWVALWLVLLGAALSPMLVLFN
jgi:hypothetical protein